MTNFLIGRDYRDYLSAMGFCVEQVLKKAGLPEDLFARQAPCLGAEEYFRFCRPSRRSPRTRTRRSGWRFPRGRARPSAKAVSRMADGFAVRRVGTLNQAFGR